jgi:FecR protein
MKGISFVLLILAGHLSALQGGPFEQAEVTTAINLVSLLPQDKRAVAGDVVKGDTGLKTGGDSRAELQFPDLTITRVGSNSLFRFIAGTREMILDSGTLLFSSPAGAGGGKVQAGAITAAVTGTDFMISNVGRVKVICLSHKVTVYLTANPKIRAELLPGQMLDITPGTTGPIRKMPRVTTLDLGKLLATSKLTEAGGFRPLASQAILVENTNRQAKAFSLAKDDLTSEATEEVRATARDTEEEATSASSTGNSGNNGNRGNSGPQGA